MNTNPQLDPRTKEIWAGVRRPGSAESAVQNRISELQARISGIDAYQSFLDQASIDSFDSYESGLKSEAGDLVEDSAIKTARDVAEPEFSSFSDFTGDSGNSTGIFGLSDYDGYRSYLTNNGLSNIDADRHNQTIQSIFDPDATFKDEVVNNISDYTELENYLVNQGFSQEDAADLRQQFEDQFASFSDFENSVSNSDSLDDIQSEFDHSQSAIRGVELRNGILYLQAPDKVRIQTDAISQTARDEQQVEPPDEASISFTGLSLSQSTVDALKTVTATATVENTGTAAGTVTATISANKTRVSKNKQVEVVGGKDNQPVRVPSSSTRTVSFEVRSREVGAYDIKINGSPTKRLTVEVPGL